MGLIDGSNVGILDGMYVGTIDGIEVGDTEKIFRSPDHEQTEAYVTGRYG